MREIAVALLLSGVLHQAGTNSEQSRAERRDTEWQRSSMSETPKHDNTRVNRIAKHGGGKVIGDGAASRCGWMYLRQTEAAARLA